jgi:hypothetical protein
MIKLKFVVAVVTTGPKELKTENTTDGVVTMVNRR